MTTRPGPLVAGVAGLVLVLAAGCSNDTARPVTVSEAPAPTDSAGAPSDPATAGWSEVVDRPTGVRFALPGDPRPTVRQSPGPSGTTVRSAQYAASEGDVQLTVNVLTTPKSPARVRKVVRVAYVPFLVVNNLRGGVTDAGVVANERLKDVPYRAFDSELGYVRDGRRTLWLTRAAELDDAVVVAQAILEMPDGEDARQRLRDVFERLTSGLDLPS